MLAVAMETTILSSQLRSLTTPSLFSLRASLSLVSLASPVRCALRATSWRNNGQICLVPERKRGATLRVRAGEQAAAGDGEEEKEPVDYRLYQALMRGGEEVASVLSEMTELLQDITQMGEEGEQVAVEMAATGALGQRLDKLDESFLMALDYMIKQADRDDKQRWLLEVIKDVVLAQLARKFPSEVQIVGILCRTPDRDARQEVLRRCAGGGGTFDQVGGGKIELPAVNLSEVGDQADEIILTMEEKAKVEDRRLLARLVLVREEARSLLSGGVEDSRIEKNKLRNLPEPEVNFLTRIIGLKPGPDLHKLLARVLGGQDEGADIVDEEKARQIDRAAERAGRTQLISKQETLPALPVRPGLFLETVNKVLMGMYASNTAAGVTVQHIEWIRKETLDILQSMAFS